MLTRPRIRTIKPEIHDDEELWDLEKETGLPLFRAFTALWNYADREGRFEWRPRALKAKCLPYWDGDFSRVLDALVTRGFLVRYEVSGRHYGLIRTFTKHQVVNGKESESILPAPPDDIENINDSQMFDASSTRASRVEHATLTPHSLSTSLSTSTSSSEGGAGGRPAKPVAPVEKKSKPIRWRRVPSEWTPSEKHMALAGELGVSLDGEFAKFRDHEFRDLKSDPDAAFRTWLRNAQKYAPKNGNGPPAFDIHERARRLKEAGL